jgi:trans-aconitate 2-methyltransferase
MPWDPECYHKFQDERFAPFEDLLALVKVRDGMRVADLGCGTGELTRRLADALPNSDVVGIDNSPQMLQRASDQERPGLRFEQASIEEMHGEAEWDLVFSHAAIQWVDDHDELIPRLLRLAKPGGQLVVQMPSNHGHVTHLLITQIAGEEPFRTALNGWSRQSPVLAIDRYAELLYNHGGRDLVVFEKIYPHVLDGPDAMADWTSGTALVPYFERLPDDLRNAFMQTYRERLRALYPQGPLLYGFRRTLFAATRAE